MAYLHIGRAPARIEPMPDGTLAFYSPKDDGLLAALKARIPYSDRRPVWKGRNQFDYWAIAPQHAQTLADLAEQYLGRRPQVPQVTVQAQAETRLLDVRYIGAAKERAGGQVTASGWCNDGWNAIFPESVLKAWFAVGDKPEEASTLYAVLGASKTATVADLKSAYRKAARQWHPDVCKEPGAEEQFKRINEAYQVLSNPLKRRKYDAGLTLAASVAQNEPAQLANVWRPPLRCGYILAEGKEQLGRFVISEILQWEDIVNSRGQTLVTSWQYGDDSFTERWV